MGNSSLAHSKYNCKYHIALTPKYRRQIIYGRNKNVMEKYTRNQIQEDIVYKQMSLKEYIDPFTGELVKKSK